MTVRPDKRRLTYRIVLGATLAFFLVKGVLVYVAISRGQDKDYFRWHRIAQRALAGQTLANPGGSAAVGMQDEQADDAFYKLPPAFAVYVAPLGLLPYNVYIGVYYTLSFAAGVAAVLMAMKMLHGRWLPDNPWNLIIPAVGILPFFHDDLHCGNNNLIIQFFLMLGCLWAARGWALPGGAGLGMAVALKAFPLTFVALLPLLRRWKLAAAGLAATAVFTFVVPGLIRGFDKTWVDNLAWYHRIVDPYLQGQEKTQWKSKGISIRNQSLWSTVNRFCRPVDTIKEVSPADHTPLYVNVVSLSSKQTAVVFAALLSVAGAAAGAVALARRAPPGPLGVSLDLAIASAFVLLASPLAWAYFFVLLLVPLAVATKLMVDDPRGPNGRLCIAACAIGLAMLVLSAFTLLQALGSMTWMALLWYVVMLILRWRLGRPARGAAVVDAGAGPVGAQAGQET